MDEIAPGETVFLSESLCWTPRLSGRAYARLVAFARERNVNVITTLNLSGELVHDLPGAAAARRYNALSIFTRHGVAHVPQAKCLPHAFEMDRGARGPGIGVSPYDRLNAVTLDLDEHLVDTRFLIGSDVGLLPGLRPIDLTCDLLVVLGSFGDGAEKRVKRLLGEALSLGVAATALVVNGWHKPQRPGQRPLVVRVEDVIDGVGDVAPPEAWPRPRSLRSAFYVYPDARGRSFVSVCTLRERRGRIAVPRSRWGAAVQLGRYPVTVVL